MTPCNSDSYLFLQWKGYKFIVIRIADALMNTLLMKKNRIRLKMWSFFIIFRQKLSGYCPIHGDGLRSDRDRIEHTFGVFLVDHG